MSQVAAVEPAQITDYLLNHLGEVFQTMLSLNPTPVVTDSPSRPPNGVSGSVGFAGPAITGAVYLHLTPFFALRATAAMLGLPPEELTDAESNDVVGEVTNMLAGGLKSWLCDAGTACALSTPSIIRGQSYQVQPLGSVQRVKLEFICDNDRFMAEVHFKLR